MSNIYDDAFNGKLTEPLLQSYMASPSFSFETVGGSKNLTPLAAACAGGNPDIVSLLLQKGAKANGKSQNGCTPFFFVVTRANKNRAVIAQILIKYGADVNEVCDLAGNIPLTLAIPMTRDRDLVHVLVDNDSSLVHTNAKGQDAKTLADKAGMSRDLRPRAERESIRGKIVDLIVGTVMFIIAYTNSVLLKSTIGGVVKQLYGISGKWNEDIKKAIKDPQTVDDFKHNLNTFVTADPNIQKFFKKDDPFLQRLAEKATALRSDMTTDLGKPENIGKLTRLSLYQPILYLDDSGSMEDEGRYELQRELVERIARIATIIVPDDEAGVGLHFINSSTPVSSKLSAEQTIAIIDKVKPSGGTALGKNLRSKILQPYVFDVLDRQRGGSDTILFRRPLLVCIITDGAPNSNDHPTIDAAIMECKERLQTAGYEITAVKFLISQIGNDPNAAKFLKTLDPSNLGLKQVLHVTAEKLDEQFAILRDNEKGLELWLLELLTGPIMERDVEDPR